jgi:hypothetical protein
MMVGPLVSTPLVADMNRLGFSRFLHELFYLVGEHS